MGGSDGYPVELRFPYERVAAAGAYRETHVHHPEKHAGRIHALTLACFQVVVLPHG